MSLNDQIYKAECVIQEFLRNPFADLKQYILEQKAIIRAQCEQLEQQRQDIENHHRSKEKQNSQTRKRPPGGAFPSSII